MKKKFLAVVLSAVTALALLAGCGKAPASTTTTTTSASKGGTTTSTSEGGATYEYDITVWCPELAVDLTTKQIADFNAKNTDGIKLNATIEAVGEGEAATQLITDVEAGADLFFFAQDQLSRLIQGGGLAQLGEAAAEFVKTTNEPKAVGAVTSGDALYAYPITSDNGFFLFYDKSIISDEDAKSVEKILEKCNETGHTFCFDLGNAWYVASYFFATGCDSTWTADDEGNFISINDTFNSDNGLIAAKGLYNIVTDPAYNASQEVSQFEAAIPAAAVVSGTWNSVTAAQILGDNLATAEMPSFTVDGISYHLGSYCGNKLIGVKPQTDVAKAACLSKLAQYLSGEEAQMERFNELSWGPSNAVDFASDAVQNDPGIAAIIAQNPYAVTQGNISGAWWDIAKVIPANLKDSDGTDDGFKACLQQYQDACAAVCNMTSDEKSVWSAIGTLGGTNWDTDFDMKRAASDGDAVFFTAEPIAMKAGEEYKVRQGHSWDVNFGVDGARDGANIVCDEDGYFFVKLVPAADNSTATVELVKSCFFGWSVIGACGGTNWDTDFEMEIQADGTYLLKGFELKAGDEFKVRKDHGWDVNFGADGVAGGDNLKVEADVTADIAFDPATGIITY